MKYIGIVGSRKRSEKRLIWIILLKCKVDSTLVSGGAEGIDSEAEAIAKEIGMPTIIYRPKLEEYSIKGNDIYFERNKLIANKCDYLFAFPLDRKGGTMNTVGHFIDYGKREHLNIID